VTDEIFTGQHSEAERVNMPKTLFHFAKQATSLGRKISLRYTGIRKIDPIEEAVSLPYGSGSIADRCDRAGNIANVKHAVPINDDRPLKRPLWERLEGLMCGR